METLEHVSGANNVVVERKWLVKEFGSTEVRSLYMPLGCSIRGLAGCGQFYSCFENHLSFSVLRRAIHYSVSNEIYSSPRKHVVPAALVFRTTPVPIFTSSNLYTARQADDLRIQGAIHPKVSHPRKDVTVYPL